jgi:hydroxymethylpyrimidine pyrophosphatase-like HAD family hydrolase
MGLRLIEKETGISIQDFAYIGDSSGDVPALRIAGRGFAPKNATNTVKTLPGVTVLPAESTRAVLQAYHSIIELNRSLM